MTSPAIDALVEALEQMIACHAEPECPAVAVAQSALALARAEQAEPVLCVSGEEFRKMRAGDAHIKAWLPPCTSAEDVPLYTTPQPTQPTLEPLTRKELLEAFYEQTACTLVGDVDFAEKVCRVVEAAHNAKLKGGAA